MPRGVYDRSKTTEQRAAEKAAKAMKPAKAAKVAKAAKAPKAEAKVAKRAYTKRVKAEPQVTETKASIDTGAKLAIVRENVAALSSALKNMQPGGALASEIEQEVKANLAILSDLRKDVFGLTEDEKSVPDTSDATVEASSDEDTDGEEEEEAAPAAAYPQGTVPMPPPVALRQ